ncbi:MAG: SGNH/GDSL hydrolase family protein, partial [Planctomycetota bacterium]|nr:SGNH/GDSL hydrolase family protein [Planctomycetota bacterium]
MVPRLAALLLPLVLQGPTAPPAGPAPAPRSPLERIVVVGASVSDGFGLERKVGGRLDLAGVLDIAVRVEHARVQNLSSQLLFVSPEAGGAGMLEKALAAEPTLVVGIDFLFWFAYGLILEEERLDLFETGLEMLADVPCPLLVGDLPDMSPAVRSPVPMITWRHVPSSETLKKLNARLSEWAAESPDRVVVPLSKFLHRVQAGEEIELRGNAWKDYEQHRFLQPDLLHPTVEGTAALATLVLDALV